MPLQVEVYLGVVFAIFIIFILIRRFILPSPMGTTARITKMMNQHEGGNQIYSHAREYAIENTLDEIKKNTTELRMKKDKILVLMNDLKVTLAKEDIKEEEKIQALVQEVKLQFVELQNKTEAICAPPNIKKYEEEEKKINPEPRILLAKKMAQASPQKISEIKRTTENDKKYYHLIVMSLLALPKETHTFLSYIEKKLSALEKKFEYLHAHKEKDLLKKVAHSLANATEKHQHKTEKEEKTHTHNRRPR